MWIKGSHFADNSGTVVFSAFQELGFFCLLCWYQFFFTCLFCSWFDTPKAIAWCIWILVDFSWSSQQQCKTMLHAEPEVVVTPTYVFVPQRSLNLHLCIYCTGTGWEDLLLQACRISPLKKARIKKTAVMCLLSIPINIAVFTDFYWSKET